MTTPVKRFLALVAAAGALMAITPAAGAAPRKVPRGFFGVMFDSVALRASQASLESQFELMAGAGVETIRVGFVWEFLQPLEDSEFDFAYTDKYVSLAARHGIEVLPVMLFAPPWARVVPGRLYSPPKHEPYAGFLRASIRRYGPKGSFWADNPSVPRRPIRDWQVWNEPNTTVFWDAEPGSALGWPRGYGSLLRASNRAIKAADPGARTVAGGLVGETWVELRRLYRVAGKRSFDVAAAHVYPQTEERVLGALRLTRRAMLDNGDRAGRLFLTETSFPASLGKVKPIADQRQETKDGMATRLQKLFGLLATKRKALNLDKVFWYTWASSYTHPKSNFEYAGLLSGPGSKDFRVQPALRAYRRVARRYEGCAKNSQGACR